MNPSASEWKPVGAAAPAPKKAAPLGSTPLETKDSSLSASARVFIPGGAPKPPLPQPVYDQGYDGSGYDAPPPPPPPGPPPPGSPTIHSPGMVGSPTGQAPPAYGEGAGTFPTQPASPNHADPNAESFGPDGSLITPGSRELSAKAAPFSPGGSNVGTPVTGTPKTLETDTKSAEVVEKDIVAAETAGGTALNVLTIEPSIEKVDKVPYTPFVNSNMPVPAKAEEAVSPAPQLNGSWSLHVDEHTITLGVNMQQAFHDPVGIATINCIENFWRLWHNVPAPSTRTPSFTYYWFRKDVKPNWEDPRNKNGGTINITLYDRDRIGIQDKAVVDDSWMTAVLMCTGESLAEANCVNGVSLKIRNRFTMMQVWTNVATKKELQAIADSLKANLKPYCSEGSLADGKLDFFTHQQVIKSVTTAAPKPKKGKPGAPSKAAVREPDFQF